MRLDNILVMWREIIELNAISLLTKMFRTKQIYFT